MATLSLTSSEVQDLPGLAEQIVPGLDLEPLCDMLAGVTFPVAGSITIQATIAKTGKKIVLQIDTAPDPVA